MQLTGLNYGEHDSLKIALLGATSHIAKGLILNFFKKTEEYSVSLFARNTKKIFEFLEFIEVDVEDSHVSEFERFNADKEKFDVLINCVGAGTPDKVKGLAVGIFRLTEEFDNLCLEYLQKNPEALYINLSSGAVYGSSFAEAASSKTKTEIDVNDFKQADFYGLAKLYSECKHRAMVDLNIVDLRVFAYFSRFIDLHGQSLMTEIANSILHNQIFRTTPDDIVRDFVHPKDLFSLVECCIKNKKLNDAFDVYSLAPVSKFALLDFLASSFGLKYQVDGDVSFLNATGIKNQYLSEFRKAEKIGYFPKLKSIESIEIELKEMLHQNA